MKLTDLKSPYRELAEMRHEQKPFEEMERNFLETNYLYLAFVYDYTKEGYDFWDDVDSGKRPPIPQSLLDELSEWQKKEPKKEPDYELTALIESPDHRLFTAAVAAMQGILISDVFHVSKIENIAKVSVEQAQALLTELNKVK